MEVVFHKRKDEETINDEKRLIRTYGKVAAKEIKKSWVALRSAETLKFMLDNRIRGCHCLTGDRFETFAVKDEQPYRMIFCAENPVPRKSDGGIDVGKVEKVRVLELHYDYH